MKIGLVIKITNGGVSEALSINKEDNWARFTDDVRPAINVLNNFDGTGKSILLVKFLGNLGYLLALIKSRPEGSGRGGDNTAAWIHIPATCDISNTEIVSVLHNVETAISASKGIDTEILNQVFNIDYNANDVLLSAAGTIASKNDADYAVRYYNKDYTLKELLGISIAQQEYSNYKGIYFIDANDGITSSCKELNFEPKKICSFPPIKSIDGFTACFLSQGNYVPYNKSIEVPEGTKITIHWVKNGYSPIIKSFVAQDNDTCLRSLAIGPNEYYIIVPRSAFRVSSSNGSPIANFDIRINNKLMDGDSMEVSEASFKQGVLLSVHAKGYSEWRETNVHLQSNMDIRLQKRVYHYEFAIPAHVGEHRLDDALVIIETHHRLTESPIEGYTSEYQISEGEGHVNRIFYNNGLLFKLKYIGIGVASCVLAILLWAGWQALDNYEFTLGWPPFKEVKQQPQTLWEDPKEDPVSETENTDSINAVAYLNGNTTWHKDSLDKYNATRGMFEELNEFKKEDINRRAEKLGNVQRLADIINAYVNTSAYDHRTGKEANNGNYNSPTDKGISVDNYIKWISTQHSAVVNNPAPESNPKPQKSQITGKTTKVTRTTPVSAPKQPASSGSKPKRGGIE